MEDNYGQRRKKGRFHIIIVLLSFRNVRCNFSSFFIFFKGFLFSFHFVSENVLAILVLVKSLMVYWYTCLTCLQPVWDRYPLSDRFKV